MTAHIAGALLLLSFGAMAWLGDLGAEAQTYLGLHGVAAAAYLLGVREALAGRVPLRLVLAVAVIGRLLLLPTPPGLSDDIFRYLWEGKVQRAMGPAAPFLHAPDAPALEPLRDDLWKQVNNPTISAGYPPLSQIFFAATGAVAYGVFPLKVALVLVELLGLFFLSRALAARGQPAGRLLLYAWNPLAVVEIAGSGHLEALGVATLAGAIYAATRERTNLTGMALGLGVMTKLMPAPLLPFAGGNFRGGVRASIVGAVTCAVLLLPYLGARAALGGGAGEYAARWRFNESLFALLAWPFGEAGEVSGITPPKLLVVAIYAALMLAIWIARYRAPERWPFERIGLWLMTAVLLLVPTVHPWYALWALPFLCFVPARPIIALSLLLPFAYEVLVDYRQNGEWNEAPWIRVLEYAPVYALLAIDGLRLIDGRTLARRKSAAS